MLDFCAHIQYTLTTMLFVHSFFTYERFWQFAYILSWNKACVYFILKTAGQGCLCGKDICFDFLFSFTLRYKMLIRRLPASLFGIPKGHRIGLLACPIHRSKLRQTVSAGGIICSAGWWKLNENLQWCPYPRKSPLGTAVFRMKYHALIGLFQVSI